jgi:hypothetical protein
MMVGFQDRIEGLVDEMRAALTANGTSDRRSLREEREEQVGETGDSEKVTINEVDS